MECGGGARLLAKPDGSFVYLREIRSQKHTAILKAISVAVGLAAASFTVGSCLNRSSSSSQAADEGASGASVVELLDRHGLMVNDVLQMIDTDAFSSADGGGGDQEPPKEPDGEDDEDDDETRPANDVGLPSPRAPKTVTGAWVTLLKNGNSPSPPPLDTHHADSHKAPVRRSRD